MTIIIMNEVISVVAIRCGVDVSVTDGLGRREVLLVLSVA